jgi:diaminopimelate decarboxylase
MNINDFTGNTIFPLASNVTADGHLQIGGCDCVSLAREYGTPLYVFDERTIRNQCSQFRDQFRRYYNKSKAIYASKAFLNPALALILKEEGIGLDVVSGGELSVASSISFPAEKIYFHGNNKTETELKEALEYKIGRIVVDNLYELEMLNRLAGLKKIKQAIMFRLIPGIDAHTHKFTTTGIVDSKFGFSLATGQAEKAVKTALSLPNIQLVGLHCHLGSPIFETSPYELAIDVMFKFAAEMKSKYSFVMREFSPGGGYAVQYIRSNPAPEISTYAEKIAVAITAAVEKYSLTSPDLTVEPGRSIVARAGVALYSVGSIKEIPGVRTYVCVDGGMGDNIRPALYEAKYEAILANKAMAIEDTTLSVAGKYCESGDILLRDYTLPAVASGDLIAIPTCGAYCIPMSSNYNLVPRPAIVMVKDGKSRIIRKRESYDNLLKLDVI